MSSLLLDEMFIPPKLETGDQVVRKGAGLLGRARGTVLSTGGWFAVVRWDGNLKTRREYIPDLTVEDSK